MSSGIQAAETIGERLRRLRLERDLSQRELSAPGVSYAYISRIEAGARRPSVKALRVLARKLGVSAEYLETGSEVHDFERRELRLAEAELKLRLDRALPEAEAELEEILAEALAAGDTVAAAKARIDLGFAAAERGDHARAAELLQLAVDTGLVSPASRADVFTALGSAWAALGQPERAVELFDRCRAQVREEAPDDLNVELRFVSQLSSALTDAGDFERAHRVLREAVEQAGRSSDPYARVRVYWSLGRVAGNEGRLQISLGYLRRAIALLESTEDTLHLARAHLAGAWVLISSGELDEAESQLTQAELLFGPTPTQVDVVMLRRHQAELARQRGDVATAVQRAREAIDVAGDALPDERGNAWFVIAAASASDGAIGDAERAFEEAALLLDEHGTPRERADCYRAWARLLRSAGREAEALDVLERAADFAADVRAHG